MLFSVVVHWDLLTLKVLDTLWRHRGEMTHAKRSGSYVTLLTTSLDPKLVVMYRRSTSPGTMSRMLRQDFALDKYMILSNATICINTVGCQHAFDALLQGAPFKSGYKAVRKLDFPVLNRWVITPLSKFQLAERYHGLTNLSLTFDVVSPWDWTNPDLDSSEDTVWRYIQANNILSVEQLVDRLQPKSIVQYHMLRIMHLKILYYPRSYHEGSENGVAKVDEEEEEEEERPSVLLNQMKEVATWVQ